MKRAWSARYAGWGGGGKGLWIRLIAGMIKGKIVIFDTKFSG